MTKEQICKMLNAGRNRGMLEALVEMGLVALVEDANGRVVPALRVIVHTEEVECPPPPAPPLPCNAVILGLTPTEGGVEIDITGTEGTHVSLSYNYNDGEEESTLACAPNTGTLNMGDGAMFLTQPNPTVYTVNVSNDECDTICDSISFTNFPFAVYVPETGDDTVFTPTGLPACAGVAVYTLFFDDGGAVDVELNEDGTVTIPAQTIATSGIFGYSMTCDGVLVASVIVTIANPPLGLRMVFDDISDLPTGITDVSDVAEWNTLLDLPDGGAPFTSVYVSGDTAILVGGVIEDVPATYIILSTVINELEDQAATLEYVGTGMFWNTGLVVANIPSTTFIGTNGFSDNALLTTVIAPSAVTILSSAFQNDVALTSIDIRACVNLGADPTDIGVFSNIVGNTISVIAAAVHQTNNGGSMHASLAALDGNNIVTFTWI